MTLGQRPEESDERMRVSGEAAFQVVGIVRDKWHNICYTAKKRTDT